MKYVRFFLALFTIGIIISSCQKDLAFETGNAVGTLAKDASGDCAPILINGNYKSNIVLDATNYVEVQVNITELGAYTIKTDTVNGYSFSAVGSAGVTGLNTIRLIGIGKPLVVGFDVFTVKFGTSTCQFNVIVTTGTGGGGTGAAIYTLGNTAGNCNATVTGTFTQGAITIGNYVDVAVTVQTAGTYTISTTNINGVSFSGTGSLTAASTSIRLYALGNPQNAGPIFTYPLIISASNTCSFDIAVLPSGGGGGASTDSISATINGVFKLFDDIPSIQMDNSTFPGYTVMVVAGDSIISSIEGIQFGVGNATGIIPTGTYTVNQGPAIVVGGQYTDANAIDYLSVTGNTNPTPAFTVTITSITGGVIGAPGTRVKGTFSGALKDTNAGTVIKTITGGYFDLTF